MASLKGSWHGLKSYYKGRKAGKRDPRSESPEVLSSIYCIPVSIKRFGKGLHSLTTVYELVCVHFWWGGVMLVMGPEF